MAYYIVPVTFILDDDDNDDELPRSHLVLATPYGPTAVESNFTTHTSSMTVHA